MTPVRAKDQRRADILSAFARRAIFGVRAQRRRIAEAEDVVTFDLDFYAHAAWQLREAGRQAHRRLQALGITQDLANLLAALDADFPHLVLYRDKMTHALDDTLPDLAWFKEFAVNLLPGGRVEYVIDSRDAANHTDALERFFAGLIDLLEPFGSDATKDLNANARLKA